MKTMSCLAIISLFATLWISENPASAESKGTHFLLEPYTGMVIKEGLDPENAVGFESGALLAVGGKFRGFPPRFYLYFRAAHSSFAQDDVFVSSRDSYGCVRRSHTRWMGGLRMVLPLLGRLRLNLEAGAGRMVTSNRYDENSIQVVSYDKELDAIELGIGLNYRLYQWLSVGLMYDRLFVTNDNHHDMISGILTHDDYGRDMGFSSLTATIGLHF